MKRRTYTVGTFFHGTGEPRRSGVMAYLLWYSPAWKDCVEYKVEAASGPEAKRLAIERRLALETDRWKERQAS